MAGRLPSIGHAFPENNDNDNDDSPTSHPPLTQQREDNDSLRTPITSAPALTPLPLDRYGLTDYDNASAYNERASLRRNTSERSSPVAGIFGSTINPHGFQGLLEDSTHPSTNVSVKRERQLDMGASQMSRPFGGGGGGSSVGASGGAGPSVLHGPTQSDISALWKSISDKPSTTTTQSGQRPSPSQQPPSLPPPLSQPHAQTPARTNPSPTASLYQTPLAPPSPTVSSLLAAAATQPTEQRTSPTNAAALPLSLDTPNRPTSIPNTSMPIGHHLAQPTLATDTVTPLVLNPKSNVLPFVMASGIFDYGLGSGGSAATVGDSGGGSASKAGMVSYPAATPGTAAGAGSSLQHSMTPQTHLDWMPQSSPKRNTGLPTPPRYIGSRAGKPNNPQRHVFIPPQSIGPSIPIQTNVAASTSSAAAVAAAAAATQRPDDLHALMMRTTNTGPTAQLPVDLVVKSEPLPSEMTQPPVPGLWPTTPAFSPTQSNPMPFALEGEVGPRLTQAGPSSIGGGVVTGMSSAMPTSTLKRSRSSMDEGDADQLTEQCPLCPFRARSRAVLQSHLRTVHKAGSEHQCPECGAEFPWKSTLDNHVRLVHRKERPFKCQRCDKAFRWSSHLEEHVWVVHEGRKPFKCEICNKAFGRKNNMQKHQRKVHFDRNQG